MTLKQALPLVRLCLLASPLLVGSIAHAQQPGPGMDGGHRPEMRGHEDGEGMGHGMGLPPGTWWRNPEIVKNLTLTADQQKRLDDIFQQSRIQLIHLHATLEEEQVKLEPMMDANPPDSGKALAEISRIADLRADLEKATARMLLGLRGVLTADQWTKMHADRGMRHGGGQHQEGPGGPRGRRGPDGQYGPGQGGPGGPGGNLGNPPTPPPAE